jgi:predicted PurR-regulated permease PerM
MVSGTVALIFNATVILILSFYMMLDGGALAERLIVRLPPAWVPDIRLFQQHVDSIFGGFLRAALVISLTYAALNWVVLAALGQPTAVLAALVAGMLLVVPWIGGILAIIPPALVVLLNTPSSVAFRNLVILVIALFIAQQVTMQIVAPRVIGTHVGLHPLLVFAALLIGGREAGVWGILFAPPFAAVLVAMLDTFLERWQRKSGKYPDLDASRSGDGETADAGVDSQAAENTQLVELPN